MTLPTLITNAWLAENAAPNETHMIRVIARQVNSSVAYRHRCKLRSYIFERDGTAGAHVLDVPASLWMAEVPAGAYRPNISISHDLSVTPQVQLSFQILPWRGASPPPAIATAAAPETAGKLRDVAERLGAPPVMLAAIAAASAGDHATLDVILSSAPPSDDPPPATQNDDERETPNQAAARRMRDARARKKAAREAAAAASVAS